MSSLRVVYMLLWFSVFHVQNAVSGPMEVSNRYQNGNSIEQNDWRLVLTSIESRLKSLDFLYTSQLTPTLEARLEHFQNRISGMEVKLLRVEALLTSKLDRMSDNISSRHFRDDMVQTDIFRKMETAYDGITHRLAYMDRKSENSFLKLQEKAEAFSKKLDTMNNALTDKYDSIESQLSDIVDGMEDINTSLHKAGVKTSNVLELQRNSTQQRLHEMQDKTGGPPALELVKEANMMCRNSSEKLNSLGEQLQNFTQGNFIEIHFDNFSDSLEKMLNEYASKVSDLGEQVTKSDNKIVTHLNTIEKVVNSSRAEMQNALRALMVQIGKLSPKDNTQYEVIDQQLLSDMAKKLDSNFEKVILSQNTFLESCHRLQMDESQLEGQISDILNKLIDNFEGTTREHHHVLRKIEGLLVRHDIHTKKELHQANANIMTVYEQSKKESKETKEQYKQTSNNLEALFALVQNILGKDDGVIKREISKEKELIEYIQSLERALNFTKQQQLQMFDSYRATVEVLLTLSQTKQEDGHSTLILLTNMSKNISLLVEGLSNNSNTNVTLDILNSVERIYEMVKKNNENLSRLSASTYSNNEKPNGTRKLRKNITENINTTKSDAQTDIDSLIKEIFFNNGTNVTLPSTTVIPCLDVDIDVRFNNEDDTSNNNIRRCQNAYDSKANVSEENKADNEESLEIPIDLRFNLVETENESKKPYNNKNQNSEEQDMNTSAVKDTTVKDLLIQNIVPLLNITNNTLHVN
ncbi:uncharacterized protein LOC123312344 [Coccinella septempunctata]|uniref:uncharacterized protein LOC123312344 n=1 Tax=Coccinella septempunctata TaxID=41139 RepID=UPI001D067F99|nr:uncharacterized protein LOC123312344 [Coccinella septempunctata]